MAVTRTDVADLLAACEVAELQAILDASGIRPRGAVTSRELAERIADGLWWNYSTPLGYLAGQTTLEHMVRHVAKRLRVAGSIRSASGWEMLDELAHALMLQAGPVLLEDLTPRQRKRIQDSWRGTAGWAGAAATSYGTGVAAAAFLRFADTPVGRIIPWIPNVGPWFGTIKKGAAVAGIVSGPLAVAGVVLSLNSALGTSYRKMVPLLLGIGALSAHTRIQDAQEIVA